jgi:RNA polymerase sigma-70 factor (ECF subfamily)
MDDTAFVREVYLASYRRLVGQLVGVTGSLTEAEDVVQESFVRALNHVRSFRLTDNPEAWLRTVAVNLARSRWARAKRLTGLAPKLAPGPRPEDLPEERMALLDALRDLPSGQRQAIALHYGADRSVIEVAETLGVAVGTVKARLSRGRAALGAKLGDTFDEREKRHA